MHSCECVAFKGLVGRWLMGLELRGRDGTEAQKEARSPRRNGGRGEKRLRFSRGCPGSPWTHLILGLVLI